MFTSVGKDRAAEVEGKDGSSDIENARRPSSIAIDLSLSQS